MFTLEIIKSIIDSGESSTTEFKTSFGQEIIISLWIKEIRTKTEPAIIPDAEEFTINGKTIVALSVQEFPVKPVAVQGRYYKRVKKALNRLSKKIL
ncbi:MAG: hypothetical protein LBE13_18500 [Bacteroidales bacterium]|jgi:ATP-dependent DNA helicase RecG|nr:hypothetical protein [Bacteroidales bacterium]